MSLFKECQELSTRFSEKILFNKDISYGMAFLKAKQRAAFLQQMGVKKDDVVGILAANSPDWCITYLSIVFCGAYALPLDTNLKIENYISMISKVKAKAVFVSPEYDQDMRSTNYSIALTSNIADEELFKPVDIQENQIASLIFTSGTTGDPKIVSLTHANILKTSRSVIEYENITEDFVFLGVLPLYHIYGFVANFTGPWVAGCRIVLQPSLKAQDIVKSLSENTISIFPGVPQLWELFMDGIINKVKAQSKFKYAIFMFFLENASKLRKAGFGKIVDKIFAPVHDVFGKEIRFLLSGGASLKKQYHHYYHSLGLRIVEGYGLTEATGPALCSILTDIKPGSVGKPIPGNEVEIRNTNDAGIGEIWLRGISIMPGYYNNPKANAEVFDSEGWYNTGDLGFLDKDDDLHITGRLKNVIVLDSGKNVYPEELEAFYQASTLIEEIAVFGRVVEGKEIVYAVVVPFDKQNMTYQKMKQEIVRMGQGQPSYKVIAQFALSFEKIPRNSSKKIVVREVVRLLEEGTYITEESNFKIQSRELKGDDPVKEKIIQALKNKLGRSVLYERQILSDFDLDSLKTIDLIAYCEEALNISIDPSKFVDLQSIKELVDYFASCTPKTEANLNEHILRDKIKARGFFIYNPLLELVIAVIRFISKKCWDIKLINPEKLQVDNCIIIANHQSFLDSLWLTALLSFQQRKNIYMIGKRELSFFRYIFWGLPVIFVEREGNVAPSLKAGADVLRKGKSLIVFPEGTRTYEGHLNQFKTGAAYLAFNLGIKIIPVTINGAYAIYPRQKILPDFFSGRKGSLTVGDPIDPKKYKNVEELNNACFKAVEKNLRLHFHK